MNRIRFIVIAWQALLERDLRAIIKSRSQLYSSFLLPLALLAILGSGVSSGLEPNSPMIRDGDYVSFLVPGIIAMTALFSSTFSSASYYQDRDSGLLKVLFSTPHSPYVILSGKSLASVVIGSSQALLVLLIASLIPPVNLGWQYGLGVGVVLAIIGIVVMNFLLVGFAHLLSTRIRTMAGFHLVMNLVLFPLFFLSGAFFPLDSVPTWLQVIGYINPLSYAIDFLHIVIYADSSVGYYGLYADIPVTVGIMLFLTFLIVRYRPNRF